MGNAIAGSEVVMKHSINKSDYCMQTLKRKFDVQCCRDLVWQIGNDDCILEFCPQLNIQFIGQYDCKIHIKGSNATLN